MQHSGSNAGLKCSGNQNPATYSAARKFTDLITPTDDDDNDDDDDDDYYYYYYYYYYY